ncbi:hypothetical protein ES705_45179 [subsurface metagenome]
MTNKKILTLISLLLILFLLVGCKTINQPPVITSTPAKTATVEVEYIYDVNATDPNTGDVLTYSLIDEPTGMLIDEDNGVITWTPTATGSVEFTVVVTDEGGLFDDQDVTITVSEFVKELIGIEVDPEEMTLYLGGVDSKPLTITAQYNDDTTPEVTLLCDYGSSNNSIAEVSIDGVVTAVASGTATITISYKEGEVTEEAFMTVTVDENHPPVITSAPVITATVGIEYTYNVIATDPDAGDVLTYSLPTRPSGMEIISTTGVISWTPDSGEVVTVNVEVSDGVLSAIQKFIIDVVSGS